MLSTRWIFLLALIALPGGGVSRGWAQTAGKAVYVVTHVDILPSGGMAEGFKLLRDLAADSRKEAGNVRFEVLQQDGRRNHLTIVEVWQSKEAFEAHVAAEHTKRFREKIQPMLGSPFDERLHVLMP